MTQAPTPGPLSGDDVKLLKDGASVLLHDAQLVTFSHVAHDQADYLYVESLDGETYPGGTPDEFVYVGERDADGWMPWSGGENPVPGQRMEVRFRSGAVESSISDHFDWSHETRRRKPLSRSLDIIAFRLAPTAPVEASGSEDMRRRESLRAVIDAATDAVLPPACETTGLGTQQRAMMQVEIARRILSARPLALEGQQGEAVTIIRDRLRQIWEGDTHLIYSGNPPEPSHDEEGDLAKLANEAVEALNSLFPVPDALSTTPAGEG